jgi:hypothetical protein
MRVIAGVATLINPLLAAVGRTNQKDPLTRQGIRRQLARVIHPPANRNVRMVFFFKVFTRIAGKRFVYSKFLPAGTTIQGYFKKEKS